MVDEVAQMGWKALASMMGISLSKAIKMKDELRKAGVIIYIRKGRSHRKHMIFFPSAVKKWLGLKSAQGDIV